MVKEGCISLYRRLALDIGIRSMAMSSCIFFSSFHLGQSLEEATWEPSQLTHLMSEEQAESSW
jgi:hypothetical protein